MNRRLGGAGMRRSLRSAQRTPSSATVDTIPGTTPTHRWRADTAYATGAWTDSIAGRVVSQATEANRPTAATASELSGQAVLSFPSATHALVSADAASTWRLLHGASTHYVVCVPRATTTGRIFSTRNSSSTASTSSGAFLSLLSGSTSVRWTVGNGTANALNAVDVASAFSDETATVISGSWDNTAYRVDTTAVAAVTAAPAATLGSSDPQITLTIGGGAFVDIAEIILWDRVLTADERTTVESYILGRYGVAA